MLVQVQHQGQVNGGIMTTVVFDKMLGQTMTEVSVESAMGDMFFKSSDEKTFRFTHFQNCCESVYIEDVVGDLTDLVGSPLLIAEEVSNLDDFTPNNSMEGTWTFYKFATNKGSVTVRWFGTSNGYYSESVDYVEE
jgi:hypothetical protein